MVQFYLVVSLGDICFVKCSQVKKRLNAFTMQALVTDMINDNHVWNCPFINFEIVKKLRFQLPHEKFVLDWIWLFLWYHWSYSSSTASVLMYSCHWIFDYECSRWMLISPPPKKKSFGRIKCITSSLFFFYFTGLTPLLVDY